MANPRKFSEKIALHNQKQAEETAAFEEIMREVIGATRNRTNSNTVGYMNGNNVVQPMHAQQSQLSNQTSHPHVHHSQPTPTQQQQSQRQPGGQPQPQQPSHHPQSNLQQLQQSITVPVSLQQHHLHLTPTFNATRAGSLPNVNQIGQPETDPNVKGTCIDLRSALINLQEIKNDIRMDCRRNTSIANRSPHRHSSHNLTTLTVNNAGQTYVNQFTNTKRSQSPYSMNNNAYLSPPPADNQWRRTNSDSSLHQSALLSNQTVSIVGGLVPSDGFHQLITNTNNSSPQDSCNNSPGQNTQNQMILENNNDIIYTNSSDITMNWDSIARTMNNNNNTNNNNNNTINSEKFLLSASLPNNQLRPRSCEVPGINIYPSQDENSIVNSDTNHHHIPISSNTGSLPDLTNLHFQIPLNAPIDNDEHNIMKINANNTSPHSNGPDSPYSPTSSHNSNLSPPPPCNIINNYSTPRNQSPRRQTSPGPSPSPTASRRRAHHNANTMVMGNHRQQTQHAVSGGQHRSTTPSDSCSAPTSPASQNISPSNSPELAINNNNTTNGVPPPTISPNINQHFTPTSTAFNSYSNQQANLLQHQLEQFRMNNDSDPANYVMTCSTNIIPQQTNNSNQNVFYLDSLTLSQFNDMSQQFNTHQFTEKNLFNNNDIFYDTSQSLNLNMQNDLFLKSDMQNQMYNNNNNNNNNNNINNTNSNNVNTVNNQPHLSNSSHCTTPQTPSSIPEIILTGPNNLDETLQTSNDIIKDLSNMSSFDSDIFAAATEDIRANSFDSFDLDSLQILHDIEANHQ